jgi:hypothetical protein
LFTDCAPPRQGRAVYYTEPTIAAAQAKGADMVHPTPKRRVNGALEVGDDETGNPCLFLFVRAESHELAILLLQAPGVLFALGGVAEAQLAGLDLIERVRETPLQIDRGSSISIGYGPPK